MDVEDKTRIVVSATKAEPNSEAKLSEESARVDSAAIQFSANLVVDDKTVFSPRKPPSQKVASPAESKANTRCDDDRTQLVKGKRAKNEILIADTPSPVSVQTRTVLKGRFELVDLLGVGGMGAVYKALDKRKIEANDSDPYVAIKVLNDDFKKHPDAFISLQRESRKSQTLAHPNIVTVYDFDRDSDMVFMTMEFLDGNPLDRLLKKNMGFGLPSEQALKILRDVSAALEYAHSHKIVHSDFKPGNIFVTRMKGAKVFDFGIARAVSVGGISEQHGEVPGQVGERTLFDAGTLGALTPAYASAEMLRGEEPSPSDDIYALGCVAYEIFAGVHPFNKMPADNAEQKRLKPKRLKQLSRRQWLALEGALQFSRDKRTATATEFLKQFFGRSRAKFVTAAAVLFSASALAASYMMNYREQVQVDQQYKIKLEQKLQLELTESRIKDKKETLRRLVNLGSLTVDWERDIRTEIKEYRAIASADGDTVMNVRSAVADQFLAAAAAYIEAAELDNAERALTRAETWRESSSQELTAELREKKERLQQQLNLERLALLRQEEQQRIAAERAIARQRATEKSRSINTLVDQIEADLRCGFSLDVAGELSQHLSQLHLIDSVKAEAIRPLVAKELGTCIKQLVVVSPQRAEPILQQAQRLLSDYKSIANLKADYCAHLSPGSGGKGDRYSCADLLSDKSLGPALVVVAGEAEQPIAMTRYEISQRDLQPFCAQSGLCSLTADLGMPVHNIALEVIQKYLVWLNQQTGYQYRLPSYREWFAAASANGEREPADRNCYLKYGGIEKGAEFTVVSSGGSNGFGLVNHVGNVQELVVGGANVLIAAGGHRQDSMSNCLSTTQRRHDGSADNLTGFRVVRDLIKY